jgi:hypothetical protein
LALSSTNWLSVTPLPMAAVEELEAPSVIGTDTCNMVTHIPPVTVIIIESA